MALSRRYHPEWPPGESSYIGIDLSSLLPPGVVLTSAELTIVVNVNPVQQQTDFAQDAVIVSGRQAWARIAGGHQGRDYQAIWTVADSQGHTWERTALLLCGQTA